MPLYLVPVLALETLYFVACATLGRSHGAPGWLSWFPRAWDVLAYGSAPRPRPDYALITRLEREFGFADQAGPCAGTEPPARP